MSSETEHGLPEQPGDTCPMIDTVIQWLRATEKHVAYGKYDEVDDLKERLDGISSELFSWRSSAEDKLEEVRAHAIKIREWGQAWKDLAKELMAEKVENNSEAA